MPRIARTLRLSIAIIAGVALAGSALASAAADPAAPVVVDIPTTSSAIQIAIDGDTVATTQSRSVDVRDVDFGSSIVGASTNVYGRESNACDTSIVDDYLLLNGSPSRCSAVAVADGVTAWGYDTTSVGEKSAAGTAKTFISKQASAPVTAVSGKWVLTADRNLIDTTAGTETGQIDYQGGLDLLHGDLYVPGERLALMTNDVLVRDLATGAASAIPVSGCLDVEKVQAAGSWMLVTCKLIDGTQQYVVVDRTGTVADRALPVDNNLMLLGNGFLARRDATTGDVDWTPLTGDALQWSTIGTSIANYGTFAVSRGAAPTIAWISSGGVAHAALLPVASSAVAAQPTGEIGLPTAPVVSVASADDHAVLSWPTPPASQQVAGYILNVPGVSSPVILPAGVTAYTVTGLTLGETESVSIKAENASGDSAARLVTVAAHSSAPQQFEQVTGSYDATTGAITVNWVYTQEPYAEAPVSFSVAAGPYSVTGLAPSARTATVEIGTQGATSVLVTAVGAHGSSSASADVDAAGANPPAPVVTTTGLPVVTLGTAISASFTAKQGVAPVRVDVREEGAPKNAAFHAWKYPASDQGVLGRATLHATGLGVGTSYCFETRTTDIDGVQSSWSAPECTAVAIDDKLLPHSGAWKRLSSSAYFHGSELESVNTGSRVTTSIRASRIWIVATTCATCGDIGLKVGLTTMWVSLHSSTTHRQVAIEVPWGANINGTVSLMQRRSGQPVRVDGLAYLSY